MLITVALFIAFNKYPVSLIICSMCIFGELNYCPFPILALAGVAQFGCTEGLPLHFPMGAHAQGSGSILGREHVRDS